MSTIRCLIFVAMKNKWPLWKLDVNNAFLYGDLEEDIYMNHPEDYKEIDGGYVAFEGNPKGGKITSKASSCIDSINSTNRVNNVTSNINVASSSGVNVIGTNISIDLPPDLNMPSLEDIGIFEDSHDDEDVFSAEADFYNLDSTFQMSSMGELTFFLELQVKHKKEGIFISQNKYVAEILKKFRFSDVKKASTPMETSKPLLKDENGKEVDVHMYRSMIGSLMYLTSSMSDIMFVVCACARYQVTPKVSHLHVVKRIFRYLKGQPKLGLWYPMDSSFDLVAYTNSDYVGVSLDRKSTTEGCEFLGCRLISWQYKKQIVVVNSTTEAEYVACLSCCGQVL
nr:uncharacterized mitochondrial protein AtMg00810-like [Tanacetum cinerariifolium]